jgi:hypothetical protein
VAPISGEAYLVRFTADSALKAKLEQAEELMRHRVGKGNLAAVLEHALDLLIDEVKKERFGAERKPRSTVAEAELEAQERGGGAERSPRRPSQGMKSWGWWAFAAAGRALKPTRPT